MLTKLRRLFGDYPQTISLFLGAVSVLALPPYFIFPILFLTFSGLLILLQKAQSSKMCFKIGYWFGFGFYACGLSWIGNAMLIEAQTFGWLYPVVFLASGAFFGLFTAFPAYFSALFKNIYAKYLAFSACWVIFEWIRSFILTGFPWNLLGTTLAFSTTTIQLAAVIGTYGLTLLVIMITAAPGLYVWQKTKSSLLISSILITTLSATILIYGTYRIKELSSSEQGNIKIRLVQPSIPQSMKWSPTALDDNLNKYIAMSQKEGLSDVDFVIWGETASPFPLDFDDYYRDLVTNAVPDNGHLITGLVRYQVDENNRYQPLNSLFVINKQGEIEALYDKSHLVPFGEYIPLRQWLPSWIRPITNTIANFKAGNGPTNLQIASYPKFGALICYEAIFPAQVVNKDIKPQWLVNLTNDGWYGMSAGPHQHLVSTRMRAVEEGLTIVRVANTGISAVINRLGGIASSLGLNRSAILDTKLPKQLEVETIYGKYGNNIPLILSLLNLVFAFIIKKIALQRTDK